MSVTWELTNCMGQTIRIEAESIKDLPQYFCVGDDITSSVVKVELVDSHGQ